MGDRHDEDLWKEDRDAARWEAEQAAEKRRAELAADRRDRLHFQVFEEPRIESHLDVERNRRERGWG